MAGMGNPPEASEGAKPPRSAAIHPGPGFRIRTDFPRLDAGLVKAFEQYATPEISDLLNRLYALDSEIVCMSGGGRPTVGLACTVRTFPGDNLMVHKSLDVAHAGDVVVVAASAGRNNAVIGDTVAMKAMHRGIAGFVVDGLMRDLPAVRELDYPMFARGTTPVGPLHRGPGEINFPVACGGVVVNPGDIVVGDDAGVVIVPQQVAEELLERLERHTRGVTSYLAEVRKGNFSNAWVDQYLAEHDCPVTGAEPDPVAELPLDAGIDNPTTAG